MTKVSDSIRSELNNLAVKYLCLFVTISICYFVDMLKLSHIFILTFVFIFIFFRERNKIIKKNKNDIDRRQVVN